MIKALCFYHPDDDQELRARQERELIRLYDAARTLKRELLIEIIAAKHGPITDTTIASVLERLYSLGIKPDWWKLEAQSQSQAWTNIAKVIEKNDPLCRGIMLLGLDQPEDQLLSAFRHAKSISLVKGFAIGRTIFATPAREWFSGKINDGDAIDRMAQSFSRLIKGWEAA